MKDKHGKPPNGGRDILDRAREIAGCSFADVPPVRVDRVMMPDGSAKEFRATKPGRGEFANMARERWSILEIMTIFQMLYLPGSIRDPKGILAWNAAEFRKLAQLATPEETRNFSETLHGLYQSALMTLGASAAMKGDIAGRTRYTINGLKREIEKKQGDANQLDRIEELVRSTDALVKAHLPPTFVKMLQDIGKNTEHTQAGVSFLVCDRKNRQKANTDRGKKSQAEGAGENASERLRADRNLEKALARVHERVKKQGQQILAACRWVCAHFDTFTDAKKNAPTYLPLSKADGKPMKPETLARYYRKRHGSKQGKK